MYRTYRFVSFPSCLANRQKIWSALSRCPSSAKSRRSTRQSALPADAGADASATTPGRSDFPAGTVVRDAAGVQIGTIMDPDPAMSSAGRVTIKTSTGFITVPRGSLTLQGDVAISKQPEADLRASGKTKAE